MSLVNSLQKRRTYYNLKKELPVSIDEVMKLVENVTELTPDAFNMKSSRVVVVYGDKQNELWDKVYNVFEGKVPREKIDLFKEAFGTILYFYDNRVVVDLQSKFPNFADNFPLWASHASAMLQISIWSALRELEIGASLQHYNPVIDKEVKNFLNLPDDYILVAQMPFGAIVGDATIKEKEDIKKRVISLS